MKRVVAPLLSALYASTLCAGCHSYSTVAVGNVTNGNDVVLTLTDAGATALASSVGQHVTTIDGTVVGQDSAGFRIRVREVVHANGVSDFLHDEVVSVPPSAVATAQLKRIDVTRSVIAAAVVVAGAAAVARGASNSGTASGGGSPSGSGN